MIQVQGLTKHYGAIQAVQDLSFSAEEGDILGFLGPNGAGKSTTMRMLTGYTPPTSGVASVAGFDVYTQSMDLRRSVGYLPESTPLYTDMTVKSYLGFMANLKGVKSSRKKSSIDTAIDETGLGHVSHRLICNLSKGYRQRVGLAQALVGDPKVLILDEPTVGLDPAQNQEIRSLIRSMRGHRTVLISTHILPEVSMTCNKVIIINRGQIQASGSPENLVSALGETLEARALIGTKDPEPVRKAIEDKKGVRSVRMNRMAEDNRYELKIELDHEQEARPLITKALIETGVDLYEFRTLGLTLEDVFLKTINRGYEKHEEASSSALESANESEKIETDESDET